MTYPIPCLWLDHERKEADSWAHLSVSLKWTVNWLSVLHLPIQVKSSTVQNWRRPQVQFRYLKAKFTFKKKKIIACFCRKKVHLFFSKEPGEHCASDQQIAAGVSGYCRHYLQPSCPYLCTGRPLQSLKCQWTTLALITWAPSQFIENYRPSAAVEVSSYTDTHTASPFIKC